MVNLPNNKIPVQFSNSIKYDIHLDHFIEHMGFTPTMDEINCVKFQSKQLLTLHYHLYIVSLDDESNIILVTPLDSPASWFSIN